MTTLLPPSRVLGGAGFALLIAVAGEIDTSRFFTPESPAAPVSVRADAATRPMDASKEARCAAPADAGHASGAGHGCAEALLR